MGGLFVPFYLISIFIFARNPAQWPFQVGFGLLFVVANVVIFQPWVLDNTKVFYIAIFGLSPLIGQYLSWIWDWYSRRNVRSDFYEVPKRSDIYIGLFLKFSVVILFIGLIFSGTLCLVNETAGSSPLVDEVDLEIGLWFVENTPHDARVAHCTMGNHFTPASSIAGRTLISSYWGWVSNHGMPNFQQRTADVNGIFF